jgi:putative acetyltransferase
LRRERAGDEAGIAAVHAAAFARLENPGTITPEVGLVDEFRASDSWIPALSVVALVDDEIAGHVVCSRATIASTYPVLGLGPLGVRPQSQNRGVGLALGHAVVAAADALDEPLIALLGNPRYYGRFGFEPAADHGIEAPDPNYGDHFQVRALTTATGAERGDFQYAPAFDGVT